VLLLRDIKGKGILLYFLNWHELNPRVLSVLPAVAGTGAAGCRTPTLVVPTPRLSPAAKDSNPRDLHQAKLGRAAVVHESWHWLLIVKCFGTPQI